MQSSRGKTNATILIVDDISTERLILARYLEDLGYRHATATNGVEALQLAESLPIDLILLDLSMPVLNGLELLGELQNDDILRSIPVIVISGSFEQNAVRSIEAGAEDYLRKPFDPVMLRARIQNCLEKKRLRDVQVQHLQNLNSLQSELATKNQELKRINLNLEELAYTDELTGLPNRRSGLASLEQLLAIHARNANPLCCIIIDIDHFKKINDTYGHDCGDYVLHQAARRMQSLTRAGDGICRFGGEEFLILCPDTDLEGARLLANRLRQGLEDLSLCFRDYSGPVTASFGVALARSGLARVEDLLNAADRALYQAKGEGRNRVVCYHQQASLTPPGRERSPAPVPPEDRPREQFIEESQLLEQPTHQRFERLAGLTASLMHAPTAIISLFTTGRQVFIGSHGLEQAWKDRGEAPIAYSVCKTTVDSQHPLQVENLSADPLFSHLPVTKLVSAYAGAPLTTSSGQVIGTLCVFDPEPHVWTAEEMGVLADLAASATAEIELRSAATRHRALSDSYRMARKTADEDSSTLMLASASHELRTPLNGVLGMCELMRGTPLSEEQKEYMSLLNTSADSLLDTVNDILDFSKLKSGQFQLKPTPLDLRDTMAEILKPLALRADQESLAFYLDVDPSTPDRISLDRVRFRQVLVNLVGNALKFTAHGSVAITVGFRENALDVAVEDSGIGIPQDHLQEIFLPFRQVENEMTSAHRGTGLGLAIVDQLLRGQGGSVACSSAPGRGSTFTFRLPIQILDAEPVLHGPTVGLKITDPRMRQCVEHLLEAGGQSWTSDLDAADLCLVDSSCQDELVRERKTRMAVLCPPGWRTPHSDQQRYPLVRISWPVAPSELREWLSAAQKAPESRPQVEKRARKFLVVDDNAINLKVACGLLRQMGLESRPVHGGTAGLEALQTESFDVVLVDIEMPGMNGFEFARLVRAKKIPILLIAMTAHAGESERQRSLSGGMDEHLTKPISAASIKKVLAGLEQKLLQPSEGALH
jgi:diguanylate cyclase (GGDEF)-like protein